VGRVVGVCTRSDCLGFCGTLCEFNFVGGRGREFLEFELTRVKEL